MNVYEIYEWYGILDKNGGVNTKYKTREDKLGEVRPNKHGTPMKLIEYRNVFDCDVQFQDEHRYIYKHNVYNNFLKGQIKNPYDKTICGIGMIGDGKYMTKYPGARYLSNDYVCWRNTLERCYLRPLKYPAYYNITTVCDDWLNFQNFAKWYEENIYEIPDGERLHLDKDILVAGNKIYSPETCIFVPQKINMLFSNMSRKDGLPNGITMTSNGKKFKAMYNTSHLGCFDTLEEAYSKYAEKKEEAIKTMADSYREYIPQKLYDALYRYKVRIENDKNYDGLQ